MSLEDENGPDWGEDEEEDPESEFDEEDFDEDN